MNRANVWIGSKGWWLPTDVRQWLLGEEIKFHVTEETKRENGRFKLGLYIADGQKAVLATLRWP